MTASEKPFSVLVVEDDDDHAELALFHLKQCAPDATIRRVADGVEAVSVLMGAAGAPGQSPDLVLLDLKLRRLDGVGVLQKVRADPELDAVPIVIFSTSNANSDKLDAYHRRANSYVVKPAAANEYRGVIQELVSYWRNANRRPG